jgi:glycosyltransferase involved in cell wall biosynthesis
MAASPTVSVLMSVYNAERFVAEAARSILAQTYGDFEFIIFDDGSTDGSPAILKELAAADTRIRLTSRPNKGLTVTLNEALAQARGEFIARMDCDDIAMPGRFAAQVEALTANPELVCVGGWFQLIDGEGRLLTLLRVPTDDASIQRAALHGHGSICHPTAMIRHEALKKINGYDEQFKTAQDLDLWLRLGEVGKLANVATNVLKFRLHESSVSETKRVEQRRSARLACERAWQRRGISDGVFEADEPWRPGKDAESRMKFALQYGWWAFKSGQRRTALHYGMRAIRARPLRSEGWKLLASAVVKPLSVRPG